MLKKNLYILILSPVIINFLVKFIFEKYEVNLLGSYDFFSSLLTFLFLFTIGFNFKSLNKNFSITLGIISYFISIYLFETLGLFVFDNINLNLSFYICSFIWFVYFLVSLEKKLFAFFPLFLYLISNFYNNYFFDLLTKDVNITMDVLNVFLPNTQNIYNNSFKFSVLNPVMAGYPQFMSYIDALIFKFSFNLPLYRSVLSNTFIFFWLNILLFFELSISKIGKLFVVSFFSLLIVNSSWLQFLFTSSLMSERVAGYLLLGILSALFQIQRPTNFEKSYIFTLLGFVYLTKQFFSILMLVILVIFVFNKKYGKYSFFILFPYFLNLISYTTYFSNVPKEHHLRQIDIVDTILDLILFRDLQIINILEITKNLIIDKPMTYLILVSFIAYFFAAYKKKTNFEIDVYFFITFLNFLFIFLLYISAWRNMELESPIRYMYSFLIFYLVITIKSFESHEKL